MRPWAWFLTPGHHRRHSRRRRHHHHHPIQGAVPEIECRDFHMQGVVVWMRMAPDRVTYLNVWSPVNGTIWEQLRSLSLLEEVCHWRQGLRFQKTPTIPSLSLPCGCGHVSRYKFLAPAPAPCLPACLLTCSLTAPAPCLPACLPACSRALWHDAHRLTLRNLNPKWNTFVFKLPWSRCFITARENQLRH